MRAEGSTLGRVRDWSPSPAWPEGRGLMLLRPMLDVRRAELRDWLTARGSGWIDDPANEDPRFARSRARASLLPMGEGGARAVRRGRMRGCDVDDRAPNSLTLSRQDDGSAAVRSSPLPMGEGSFALDRAVSARTLAAALVCAGGGDRPPRGDRLDRLLTRLRAGEAFTAVLCGARLEAGPDRILVTREAGEFARRPVAPQPLAPGIETVWDGRWAVTAAGPGWSVAPAAGRRAALSKADRARLDALPPAARGGRPVLVSDGAAGPILAENAAAVRSLVEERLALALGRMTHESDLAPRAHGAPPRNHLFSGADFTEQGGAPRLQGSKRA